MRRTKQLQIRVTSAEKEALKRLARDGGQAISAYVLSRALPEAKLLFGELLQSLADENERRYALAALNDLLVGLTRAELQDAVSDARLGALSPYWRNYVAAMVEQAAQQKGVSPPRWLDDVEPLREPHFVVPLKGLRRHLLRASPVAFRRRNIFVDSGLGNRI